MYVNIHNSISILNSAMLVQPSGPKDFSECSTPLSPLGVDKELELGAGAHSASLRRSTCRLNPVGFAGVLEICRSSPLALVEAFQIATRTCSVGCSSLHALLRRSN